MSTAASEPPPAPLPPSQTQPKPSPPDHNDPERAHAVEISSSPDEPFPSLADPPFFQYHASLLPLDTTSPDSHPQAVSPHAPTPLSAGLRLQTGNLDGINAQTQGTTARSITTTEPSEPSVLNAGLPVRTPSIRSIFSARAQRSDSLTPSSALSSPGVGPLLEMSPLPSPISAWASPGYERASIDSEINDISLEHTISGQSRDSLSEPIPFYRLSPKKRRIPDSAEQARILEANAAAHARNRSLSEYVPEGMQVPRSRNIAVSSSGIPPVVSQPLSPPDDHMHREQYLAIQRGLAISVPKPPTPPDSNRGATDELEGLSVSPHSSKSEVSAVYEARTIHGGKLRRWRALRQLGKGTFSTVVLATSEMTDSDAINEDQCSPKSLVAVKICEQGPAGGADEKKIEVSIKRELEIMKSIHHPSLVHLKAVNICEHQAYLVLNYCAGGDLFELASTKLDLLTPSLVQRMFAELVAAVRYLHLQYIVHRDIKLENVLVNCPVAALHAIADWQTYPHPILTLTDLGLGRWISKPPSMPLLQTRCGSEDYAAPEVLLGQDYDGRSTDAWALGVLLYAIMEGRLPFDPIPGSRKKVSIGHRIARCEWQWVRWADEDGEWDAVKGEKLAGAREVVEGLIAPKRSRWSLEKVQHTAWVGKGILVDLRREEEDEGEE